LKEVNMNEREQIHAGDNMRDSVADRDELAPGRRARTAEPALVARKGAVSSGIIRRKVRDGNGVVEGAGELVDRAATSSGAPLPTALLRKFEASLGADLGSVRVHTSGASEDAAGAVGAKAYTLGQDIHFGAGHYDPSSAAGEHLLAHEVAHTVQQRGGVTTRQNKLEVSTPQDAAEYEADLAADAMVRSESFAVGGHAPQVSRKPGDATPKMASTSLTVTASYENVPGASKNGPKRADAHSALWFDKLSLAPESPPADEQGTSDKVGVTTGHGQRIAKFMAPINTDGPYAAAGTGRLHPGAGTGRLTGELKYAAEVSNSFRVTVTVKGKPIPNALKDAAKKWLMERMTHQGDVEVLQTQVAAHLAEQMATEGVGVEDVVVNIQPIDSNTVNKDAGNSHFFYKAYENPVIDLDVPLVVVADRAITSGGTTTKADGNDTESAQHHNTEHEHVDIKDKKTEDQSSASKATQTSDEEWHRKIKQTHDEIITNLEIQLKTLASKLAAKVQTDTNYRDKDGSAFDKVDVAFHDYTKGVKHETESGTKDKKNWGAWLADGLKGLGSILSLPIPVGGKWARRLNWLGLAVDAGEHAANALAVRGTVKYTDTNEDTEVHAKDTDHKHETINRDRTVTRKDISQLESELNSVFTSAIQTLKTTHSTDEKTDDVTKKTRAEQTTSGKSNKTNQDQYSYDRQHTNDERSMHEKKNQSVTTQLEYSTTVKETTTKPVLEAHVVHGHGEVSLSQFPEPEAAKK
jgi:hypothetical protein